MSAGRTHLVGSGSYLGRPSVWHRKEGTGRGGGASGCSTERNHCTVRRVGAEALGSLPRRLLDTEPRVQHTLRTFFIKHYHIFHPGHHCQAIAAYSGASTYNFHRHLHLPPAGFLVYLDFYPSKIAQRHSHLAMCDVPRCPCLYAQPRLSGQRCRPTTSIHPAAASERPGMDIRAYQDKRFRHCYSAPLQGGQARPILLDSKRSWRLYTVRLPPGQTSILSFVAELELDDALA